MRQGTPIPVQRCIHIGTGSRIIEPSLRPVHEREVEAIGVAVAATGVSEIQRDVERAC